MTLLCLQKRMSVIGLDCHGTFFWESQYFFVLNHPMWQHDIYDHGVGDCSVITKTVGNGLVMLCHYPTDFFLSNVDLTLRFMKNGIETH